MEIENLIRPHLREVQAYSSARDEFTGVASVFLDANENAFGSIATGEFNRYPDPHQQELKTKWSELKQVSKDQIFFGNGSDEPIDLLMRLFCEPGKDHIITMPPTYGMYGVSAAINNVAIKAVPLTEYFEIDLENLETAWNDKSKLVFICSPNNPSGNVLSTDKVEKILTSFSGIVVIDEAYIDFTTQKSWSEKLDQYDNLVVLQTMSKAWGMAAVRVGVAMASPYIVSMLDKIKPPYNISLPNQKLASEALDNASEQIKLVEQITEQRALLIKSLEASEEVIKVFPSDANFLLVRFKEASAMFDYLTKEGVIIRDRSTQLHCEGCLRITVGTPKENEELLALIANF